MKLLKVFTRPLPTWFALVLLAAIAIPASASAPTFVARWIVSNASATPSPAPTGYNGPVVVAQATNAPTPQPGNISVTGGITGNVGTFGALTATTGTVKGASDGATTTWYAPVYAPGGTAVPSSIHQVWGSVSTTTVGTCASNTACSLATSTFSLSGAAQFFTVTPSCFSATTGAFFEAFASAGTSSGSIGVYNISGTSVTTGTSVTVQFLCVGQ